MWIDADVIIKAASLLGAIIAIGGAVTAVIKFILKIKADQKTLEDSVNALQKKQNDDMKSTNDELTVIVYGVLSCLRGLAEQGCNGAVHEAIDKIEKHINTKAHEDRG